MANESKRPCPNAIPAPRGVDCLPDCPVCGGRVYLESKREREAVWYPVSGTVRLIDEFGEHTAYAHTWQRAVKWSKGRGARSVRSIDGRLREPLN